MYYRKKLIKRLIVTVPLLLALLVSSSILYFSSSGDGRVTCFSVDSNGSLYIGKRGRIEVWQQGQLIRTIDPQTSRSYIFRVQENDTILLSTSTTLYTMALNGDILKTEEDHGAHMYNELQRQNRNGITNGESTYTRRNSILGTKIVKDGTEIVYRMSPRAYLETIMLDISWAIIGVYVLYELYRFLTRVE